MDSIYQFDNYKNYLNYRISSLPKNGRGEFLRISKYLNVHTSLISQVLSGSKEFSVEQAFKVCDYFGLTENDRDYFMVLINHSRSGTVELKEYYQSILQQIKDKYFTVKSRIKKSVELTEQQKSQYYSDWRFMAVWLATSLETVSSIDDIEQLFNINKKDLSKVLKFLNSSGLCLEVDGKLSQGISKTHLDRDSILINRHHINWRLKAIEKLEKASNRELFFTAPLTVSKKDLKKIKAILLNTVQEVSGVIDTTTPEELACLSIDLFNIQ